MTTKLSKCVLLLLWPLASGANVLLRTKFNLSESGMVIDESGNDYHGTTVVGEANGGVTVVDGRDGECCALGLHRGKNSYIKFPHEVTGSILGNESRTICLWARVDAFDNGILFFYGARRRGRRRVQDTF